MTAVKEREVTYVEKDAKPPLVISNNPADHTPFDKKDEYWRYLPARQFDGFASTAPAVGDPNFQVSNASVLHSITTGGINGLRVRDVVTATALAAEHNQFIVSVDKAANGKLVELDFAATSESNSAVEINVLEQVETQIVLRDRCQGNTALSLAINIGKGAIVKFVVLTEESATGIHYGHISANIGRDSALTFGVIS
ncbi:MAG: hypothetical protein F2563_06000, partial [Actinobacteria bacterium]|nr:hypothetical protein [Actinomycetota bacterium]